MVEYTFGEPARRHLQTIPSRGEGDVHDRVAVGLEHHECVVEFGPQAAEFQREWFAADGHGLVVHSPGRPWIA